MNTRILYKPLLTVLVAILGVMTPFSSITAYAQSPLDDPRPTSEVNDMRINRLERAFRRMSKIVERTSERIGHQSESLQRVEEFIAKRKQEGKDTSVLEQALADFTNAVNTAAIHIQNAEGLVAAHAGFDKDGKVVDATVARETLQSIGQELKSFREVTKTPWQAVRNEIRKLRPVKTGEDTSA